MRRFGNSSDALAKVVSPDRRDSVAGTGDVQLWGRSVFAKGARLLYSEGVSAKAADYFRKRRCRIRLKSNATPGTRRFNWGSQSAMPDIRRLNWGSQSAMPDIRCPDRQLPVAMPDVRRPDWQLPVGPPDLFDHLSRHKLAVFSHQTPVFS